MIAHRTIIATAMATKVNSSDPRKIATICVVRKDMSAKPPVK